LTTRYENWAENCETLLTIDAISEWGLYLAEIFVEAAPFPGEGVRRVDGLLVHFNGITPI
jgi:hypothetical protein